MYQSAKRILDIVISIIALILLSPVLLPCALILMITGEREVFFFQNRVGLKNKYFKVFKFATMLKNSENIGTGTLTLRNDPRVTKFGSLLRKSKVNELPQILNVLLGDMSIVGPRPLIQKDVDRYPEDIKSKIYNSKPGITGIGSLIFRDEEYLVSTTKMDIVEYYKTVIMPYKGALEMWYQKKASILTDFKIIFLTAWTIIFPKSNIVYIVFSDLPKRNF